MVPGLRATGVREKLFVAAIDVAAALGYLDFRQPNLGWRSHSPQLANWYAEVSQRPSMMKTQPPV
jgi:glutathione S-transferase